MNTPIKTQTEKPTELPLERLIEAHSLKPVEIKTESPPPQPQPAKRPAWKILAISGIFIALAVIGTLGVKLSQSNTLVNSQATTLMQANSTIQSQALVVKRQATVLQEQNLALVDAIEKLDKEQSKNKLAQATIQAQQLELLSVPPMFNSELISGPLSGNLTHSPNDSLITLSCANVYVKDFVTTVRFTNPGGAAEHKFDFGIRFRYNYRVLPADNLIILARGSDVIDAREFKNVNLKSGGSNNLMVMVKDNVVIVSINGLPSQTLVATAPLDLGYGDVCVGTGFWNDSEMAGKSTKYSDFTIWELTDN